MWGEKICNCIYIHSLIGVSGKCEVHCMHFKESIKLPLSDSNFMLDHLMLLLLAYKLCKN